MRNLNTRSLDITLAVLRATVGEVALAAWRAYLAWRVADIDYQIAHAHEYPGTTSLYVAGAIQRRADAQARLDALPPSRLEPWLHPDRLTWMACAAAAGYVVAFHLA